MDPRRPAIPIEIEEDTEHVLLQSNGEVRKHYNMIYSEEDAERIRQGYCCLQCGESVVGHGDGKPFPERCAICGFRMRDLQQERYEKEWLGHIRIGPSTSLEEELAALAELEERQNFLLNPKPSIVVPRYF